jgi:hypothetical protein
MIESMMPSKASVKAFVKSPLAMSIAVVLFFASVFIFFAQPAGNSDFWWHISTGRWICQGLELPGADPFTYTSAVTDVRTDVILKGFWLSQVIYYASYAVSGLQAPILLNALVFMLVFYTLWRVLAFNGIDHYTALVFLAPLVFLSTPFIDIRPQVFSFLGTPLLFLCIEKGLKRLREERPLTPLLALSLPAVMLLWGNLHRGYIIGLAVMGIYAVCETLKYTFNRNALAAASLRKMMLWTGVAVIASFFNPALWHAIPANLWELGKSVSVRTTDEFLSPLKYAAYADIYYYIYGLSALAVVTLAIMAASWRRLEPAHVLLYAGFLAAALSSFRFCIFYMLMSAAISSRYLTQKTDSAMRSLYTIAAPLAVAAAIAIFSVSAGNSSINRGALMSTVPVEAVDFIERRNLPGKIFNSYEWGGYLTWRLYPDYRVFIDGRTIDNTAVISYMAANMGNNRELFDAYGINTVIFTPYNTLTYSVPGLVFSLLKDNGWRLAYFDRNSAIFVRAEAMPTLTTLNKSLLWDSLKDTAEYFISTRPGDPGPLSMLAGIYAAGDEMEKATGLLERAQKAE